MKISIFSRKEIQEIIKSGRFPENTVVISYYDPNAHKIDKDYDPVDYSGVCDNVFSLGFDDIDINYLEQQGYTYETYFPESVDIAEFIYNAYNNGMDIICQCDYGKGRSAGTAAAIAEHFYNNGIWIFADYERFPNKILFHKIFEALENYKKSAFIEKIS